ncbi:hypothetical protein ERJ75_001459600 [Trypanosoma vivax]|nr:hypothetical protein ERJ75_001459600 [Trypanosoma vivax]
MPCVANGVRGGALFEQCFFLKAVCRRLSKLNWGLLRLSGGAALPAQTVRQGRRLPRALLGSKPVLARRHRPASATLSTDASMCGWGALLLKDGGEVCVAGDAWDRGPCCISQAEARAASLAPCSFAESAPKNLHIFVDNTTVTNAMKKGSAHSDVLGREPPLRIRRCMKKVFRPLGATLPLQTTLLMGFRVEADFGRRMSRRGAPKAR